MGKTYDAIIIAKWIINKIHQAKRMNLRKNIENIKKISLVSGKLIKYGIQ